MSCNKCNGDNIVKNGKRRGKQCYLCKGCNAQFLDADEEGMPWEHTMAILMYCRGMTLREIAAKLCYHYSVISRWVKDFAKNHENSPKTIEELTKQLEDHLSGEFLCKCGSHKIYLESLPNNISIPTILEKSISSSHALG